MNVVLISRDHRLGAILTMALAAPEQLTVLDSPAEVPESRDLAIDAVVLDLPADSRRHAYDELRQRYEGRVVVPVDSARDTSGWPPDAKRRFLVRPFQVADLIAGVQEPQETSVAERAAKYRRRFRWNRHQPPAFPSLAVPSAEAEEPSPPAQPAEPAEARPTPESPEEPSATAEPLDAASEHPPEEAATEEAGPATDIDDGPPTVEFTLEAEKAAAGEAPAEADVAEEEAAAGAEQPAGAATDADEDREPAGATVAEEAEAAAQTEEPAGATADAGQEPAEDEAVAEAEEEAVAEAEAEEPAEATADAGEEPAEDEPEQDSAEQRGMADAGPLMDEDDAHEALIAAVEELLLANAREGEAPSEPQSVKELLHAAMPEAGDADPDRPPRPTLPVRAGVAMAEAVALQQWLENEEAKRSRTRRRRIFTNVAAGLVLLLVGAGVGRVTSPEEPQQVNRPPATQNQVVTIRNAPPPAACTQAMDNADEVISYLVAKIRDERLSKSIQEYGANARACRNTGR